MKYEGVITDESWIEAVMNLTIEQETKLPESEKFSIHLARQYHMFGHITDWRKNNAKNNIEV